MPTLYLHSMAGKLLCKTTVEDASAIHPGLKAALHILAARYYDPSPLEQWVTLGWRNDPSGDIYVSYVIEAPSEEGWSYSDECVVCECRGDLRCHEPDTGFCSRCWPAAICWTCSFWERDCTPICVACLTEDEAKWINKYHRRRRAAVRQRISDSKSSSDGNSATSAEQQ